MFIFFFFFLSCTFLLLKEYKIKIDVIINYLYLSKNDLKSSNKSKVASVNGIISESLLVTKEKK